MGEERGGDIPTVDLTGDCARTGDGWVPSGAKLLTIVAHGQCDLST